MGLPLHQMNSSSSIAAFPSNVVLSQAPSALSYYQSRHSALARASGGHVCELLGRLLLLRSLSGRFSGAPVVRVVVWGIADPGFDMVVLSLSLMFGALGGGAGAGAVMAAWSSSPDDDVDVSPLVSSLSDIAALKICVQYRSFKSLRWWAKKVEA
jgi:hypothetical protein